MRNFIVVTPPRSRSAWLANFLCWDQSFCYHEVIPEVDRIEKLPEYFQSAPFPVVGTVDNGAALFSGALLKTFPEARFVTIHRPINEVRKALEEIDLPAVDDYLNGIENGMFHIESMRPDTLRLEYKNLNANLLRIWEHCVGPVVLGGRWDAAFTQRIITLNRTKIELDMDKEDARLRFLAPNIESLFANDMNEGESAENKGGL